MRYDDIKYNEITKVETIKEIIELAVREAPEKNAFEYKNPDTDEIVGVTYKEFQKDNYYLENYKVIFIFTSLC